MNKSNIKDLSIQISLSGLSFCILNRTSNSIEFTHYKAFKKQANPFETLEYLKQELTNLDALDQTFSNVLVIYQNGLSNLVPKALYEEEQAADYLKFNSKILNTDYISHDEISINDSINVYVPYVNINNYIFDTFGEFEYKHSSTILIESLLKETAESKTAIYININEHHFELVAIKGNELLLYNSYEYSSKEDVIYYLLFAMEQLQLHPETTQLNLMGLIDKEDDIYSIIYTYVRHVEFYQPHYKFTFQTHPKHLHRDAILLNSF